MSVNISAFGANDIRGIYPDMINEEMAYRVGRFFPQVFQAKRVAVGRDIRLSGESLQIALVKGLIENGSFKFHLEGCVINMRR